MDYRRCIGAFPLLLLNQIYCSEMPGHQYAEGVRKDYLGKVLLKGHLLKKCPSPPQAGKLGRHNLLDRLEGSDTFVFVQPVLKQMHVHADLGLGDLSVDHGCAQLGVS